MVLMRTLLRIAAVTLGTAIAALAALAALAAVPAAASSPSVVNFGASQIGGTSAVLNGMLDTSDADSAWFFQYGPTTSYGKFSKVTPIATPNVAQGVQAVIGGLSPNTTYHFRLVLESYVTTVNAYTSADGEFTTTAAGGPSPIAYGTTTLRSRRLRVHRGVISIPFTCAGAAGARCQGAVLVFATGRLGRRLTTVGCAGGSFSAIAGQRETVTGRLSRACKALVRRARGHRLAATLRATFSSHQSMLKAGVTVIG